MDKKGKRDKGNLLVVKKLLKLQELQEGQKF